MKTIILFSLTLFLVFNISFAQIDTYEFYDPICGYDAGSGANPYPYPYFPVNYDTLKVLVIFCNFPDGDWDPDPPSVATQYWPGNKYDQKPDWADSVICPTTTNIWNNSMTAFYKSASMGEFFLIGDVYEYLYLFEHNIKYYSVDSGRNMGYATKELLEALDDSIDYSQYDKFAPNEVNKHQPDSVVDFIFILFRFNNSKTIEFASSNPNKLSYTGIAMLGGWSGSFAGSSYITLDGKKIYAGFPGSPGSFGSGALCNMFYPKDYTPICHELGHYLLGGHLSWPGFIALMSGNFVSAFEREALGWGPSAINVSSNTTVTLRDYATTGDFIKFIRGSQTYYIQNMRRIDYHFSHQFHAWHWFENDPLLPYMSDSTVVIYKPSWSVDHAFGRWNWSKNGSGYYYYDSDNFIIESPNGRYGETIMDLRGKGCVDLKNNYLGLKSHSGFHGDSNTCFDLDYNEVYSPWSNPGVKINSSNDSVALELIQRDRNGDMDINFYLSNLTETSPTKPQLLKLSKDYIISGMFHPKLDWFPNSEPDLDYYKIYRGYVVTPGVDPTYYYLGYTSDTTYIDNFITLYDAQGGGGACQYEYKKYYYKITAIDEYNDIVKESVRSDRDSIDGYDDPCAPEENPILSSGETPAEFNLKQNYPNPFNPVTNIQFDLPKDVFVTIKIYDVLGREVATLINDFKKAGSYIVSFNGSELSSGVYFYKIKAGFYTDIKRMILLK